MSKTSIIWITAILAIIVLSALFFPRAKMEVYMQRISRGDIVNELSFSGMIKPLREENFFFTFEEGTVIHLSRLGADVTKDSYLFKIQSRPAKNKLDLAQLDMERSRFAMKTAHSEFTRSRELFASNSISKSTLNSADNFYMQAKAAWKSSELVYNELKNRLKDLSPKAPFSCKVTDVNLIDGQKIYQHQKIMTISSKNDFYIEGFLSEYDRARVKVGLEVEIQILYSDGLVLAGVVDSVSSSPVQEGQFFGQYRIRIKPQGELKDPLFYAECGVVARLQSFNDVTMIPARSLLLKDGKKYIYGVKKNRAYLIPVTPEAVVRGIAVLKDPLEYTKVVLDPESSFDTFKEKVRVKEKKENEIKGLL